MPRSLWKNAVRLERQPATETRKADVCLPEAHLAPLSEPAWCGSYWWVATVRRQAARSLARYWWERKRERNGGRVNVGVWGRKKTRLSGLIHQIGPLNSPLDMIFRQTERECVNKNHGYSLCPSVLTSQEITDSPERGSMPCVNSQLFCFRIIEVEERRACTILWDWCSICQKPKVLRVFYKRRPFNAAVWSCFLFVLVCFMRNWFIQYIFIALRNSL